MPLRDHIDGFELSDEFLKRHGNDARALDTLWAGLGYLYDQVAGMEREVALRFDPRRRQFIVGTPPELQDVPMELVACTFHWYAVSASNLVRLIGWLRSQDDSTAPRDLDYVEAVLPEVKPFRDKVAAHFARMSGSAGRDNDAERFASTCTAPGWTDGRFVASPLQFHLVRGGTGSTSGALKPWSLTQVHEGLLQRYSPSVASAEAAAPGAGAR